MDLNLIDPLPAELMATIEKEYQSARAHMDRFGNIRAWEVSASLERAQGESCNCRYPLHVSDMVCDKETAASAVRNMLIIIATHAYLNPEDIAEADTYLQPAVRYPDEPDWDLYERL